MDGDIGTVIHGGGSSETGSRTLLRVYLTSNRTEDALRELENLQIVEGQSLADERLVAETLDQAGRAQVLADRSTRILADARVSASIRGLALFHSERLARHRSGYALAIERVEAFLASCADSTLDSYVVGCLRMLLGGCWRRLRRMSDARRELDAALRMFEGCGEFEQVADCLMLLGLCSKFGRDWNEAEAIHLGAARLYEGHGLSRKLTVAMANLGVLRLFRGHFQGSISALQRTRVLAAEGGDELRQLVATRDIGLALCREGNLEAARRQFSDAWPMGRRLSNRREHALLHEYLGELALHEGRLDVARRWLKKGYELARRAPELDIMGETRCRLAEVELRAGSVETARAIIDECLADFEKMEDLYEVAVCRRVRGEVLRAQGAHDDARASWEQALEFFETIGERYEREKVVRLLRGESAVGFAPVLDSIPPTPEEHSLDLAPISEFELISDPAPSSHPTSPSPRKSGRPLVRWSHTSHPDFPEIIGAHPVLLAVLDRAKQYAESDSPVLIQGETGTGKELVAAALHRLGANPAGAYLPYNCGGGSPELIDAELFGHTRGSFTGATSERLGLIRSARNGTLFLDEIGEFEENLQTRLLRFLDRGEIRVVGSDRPEQVPVRVIAATHQDLDRQVGSGKFRRDLLHRFSLRLSLPPLRERRSDIALLIEHFVREVKVRKPEFSGLSGTVIEQMLRYDWPGNVRELRNAILDLGLRTAAGRAADDWRPTVDAKEATETTTVLSREVIIAELQRSGGLVRGACSRLGISHQRFYRRCRELGIEIEAYRS